MLEDFQGLKSGTIILCRHQRGVTSYNVFDSDLILAQFHSVAGGMVNFKLLWTDQPRITYNVRECMYNPAYLHLVEILKEM